jgi:two-component system sensor histidine kinase UhpB
LHDQVGQGLTALLLQLRTVVADAPESLREGLFEAQAIARGNLDEVRRIARRLRPTVLDDLGLPYAVLSLADAAEEQAELSVVRRVDASVPHVSESAELALYRIAQEALTNTLRHADASRVELVLEASEDRDRLQLVIHDDGRGMLFAADVERGGIRGMRERALAVDAELSITTRPGGGTSVFVSVPVER